MRVLLAEDEQALSRALVAILEHEGFVVDAAPDGEEALYLLDVNDYDVVVLDIMMPKVDGLTVLRQMRADGRDVPVLLLTAKSEIRDRVEGLDSGANDYLTKPFAAQELLARLRVLTRASSSPAHALAFGDLELDEGASALVVGETRVDLTPREYQMMEMLVAAGEGKTISTDAFMRKVWGGLADVETGVIWVNLSNLRKKLAKAGSTVSIVARRGVGYHLQAGEGDDA